MNLHLRSPTLRSCCVLLGAAWATSASSAPPDLTGIWIAAPAQTSARVLANLPLTAAGKGKVTASAQVVPAGGPDSPQVYCLGPAMPALALLADGNRMEILQRPERITINTEKDGQTRRLFLQNKQNPEEQINSRLGYSVAEWRGETLVVETQALSESLEGDGAPLHGENAKLVERYRLTKERGGGRGLVVDVTLTDPDYYAKPIRFSVKYLPSTAGHMAAYGCNRWALRVQELKAAAAAKEAAPAK